MKTKTNKKIIIFLSLTIIASLLFMTSISSIAKPKVVKSNKTGISGAIFIGPVTPVSKIGVENKKPYKATIIVLNKNDQKKVTQFTSKNNGYFFVSLKPGTYILKPIEGAVYPKANPIEVKVIQKKISYVIINFDSGIR